MSFQITFLKVLAGYPGGQASVADLRSAIGILMSSGKDWTDRVRRLAERAPDLDIFGQGYVVSDAAGWRITEAGRGRLAAIENPVPVATIAATGPIATVRLRPMLIGLNERRSRRRRRRAPIVASSSVA